MGVLTLDTPLEVKIQEGGQEIETLKITYRYPTKEEEKAFDEHTKKMQELFKKLKKIESEASIIDKKIEYAEKREDYEKAEKLLDKKEKLEREAEKLTEEFEKNGGEQFQENISKMMYDVLVGGKDKERLRVYAERVSYTRIIELLNKEREQFEKKQFG